MFMKLKIFGQSHWDRHKVTVAIAFLNDLKDFWPSTLDTCIWEITAFSSPDMSYEMYKMYEVYIHAVITKFAVNWNF